ncbi:MAG: hypothetical protein Q9199_006712 [Rusavskia elegans]
MARFDDLPNELLTIVLDYVAIADFENFAQINRLINSLAQQRLEEHRRWSRLYASTTIPTFDLRSTYDLLKNIMHTDQGQYIRTLVLDRLGVFFTPGANGTPNQEWTPSAVDCLVHEVCTRKIFARALEEAEGTNLREEIWTHRRDILSVLPLLCTPNVRHLKLPSNSYDPRANPVWLQAILRQAILGNSQTVLGKLTSVFLYGNGLSLSFFQDLIRIPSVRKLQLDSLKDWIPQDRASAPCPLETVELMPGHAYRHNTVNSRALHAFLAETNFLTTLDIQSRVFENVQWPELLTFADIMSPVCSTLRNLTILYPKGEHNNSIVHWLGSFADFTALEHFEADLDGIYPQYLPSSLRTIKLHGKACCIYGKSVGKKRYSARIFIEAVLEGHKSGANPRLKHVEFTDKLAAGNKRSRELLEESMRQCAPFGIQLKAPDVVNNALAPTTSRVPS